MKEIIEWQDEEYDYDISRGKSEKKTSMMCREPGEKTIEKNSLAQVWSKEQARSLTQLISTLLGKHFLTYCLQWK